MPSSQPPPKYAYEARKRAHELRREDWSLRRIARELDVSLGMVQKYLREPVRSLGVYPSTGPLSSHDATNVRNVQGVWTDLSMHIPDIGVYTPPSSDPLWDLDEETECLCGYVINGWHKQSGKIMVWVRSPEFYGKNQARMLYRCPIHNVPLAEIQCDHIQNVGPESLFGYRFWHYSHVDSARRAAYRLQRKDQDGSYIIARRIIYGETCWDMMSAHNLTPRKASAERAKTIEVDKTVMITAFNQSLNQIASLRTVQARELWIVENRYPKDDESPGSEPRYDIVTSGTKRTILDVAPRVIGRTIHRGDMLTDSEWEAIKHYLQRRT
jgi:hypothetical protein